MRTVFYCALICLLALVLVLSSAEPQLLSDQNTFLKAFVNHEFLNILGVIVAITLASSANLHLRFNDIEEKYKQPGGLTGTRGRVHYAAYTLIIQFLFAIVLVIIKPHLVGVPWIESLINGFAIIILFWNMLILLAITRLIFSIKPDV